MRIHHFFLRTYKNCLYNVSRSNIQTNFYTNCLLVTPLKFFKFDLVRSFLIYHSIFKNSLKIHGFEDGCNNEKKEAKTPDRKKKSSLISVINESGQEIVMEVTDAEKYAKRKKMRLVPVEKSVKEKLKFKLVKIVTVENRDLKKVMLREEIGAHDLETKINQVLKFMNKGLKVMCFIEGSSGSEKLNNILNTLEKSKLNEFLVTKTKNSRGVQIVYERKAFDKEKN